METKIYKGKALQEQRRRQNDLLKEYRQFLVQKFGKAAETTVDADERWMSPKDFTRISSKRQSRQSRNRSKPATVSHLTSNNQSANVSRAKFSRARDVSDGYQQILSKGSLMDFPSPINISCDLARNTGMSQFTDKSERVRPTSNLQAEDHSILPRCEEAAFLQAVLEIIGFERELEEFKIGLSKCNDFNLIDAFGMLDQAGKGFISASQLCESLTSLDLPLSQEDCKLFFHRYNRE